MTTTNDRTCGNCKDCIVPAVGRSYCDRRDKSVYADDTACHYFTPTPAPVGVVPESDYKAVPEMRGEEQIGVTFERKDAPVGGGQDANGSMTIDEMSYTRERGLEIWAKYPGAYAITSSLAQFFKDSGGINFVEFGVFNKDTGPLTVTIQRREGETPAQQALKAKATVQDILAVLEDDGLAEEIAFKHAVDSKEAMELFSIYRAALRERIKCPIKY